MARSVKVVGLGGSLDGSSSSLAALHIAANAAEAAGARVKVLDLHALSLPMYEPGLEATPCVQELVNAIGDADGLIWSSPLYHGTISGAFKNAMDWLELLKKREPAYLTDKVVGLISTAGGVQGLQAINTMEYIVRALRGWTVPLVVPVARAWQAFEDDGRAKEEAVQNQLEALGREVARAATIFARVDLTTPDAQEAQAEITRNEEG